MGRPPLRIDIAPKDQKPLIKVLSGGIQQVRVVLRALALLQLAKGASAPQIANVVPLTSQAIRNIGRRYQQGGLERALYEGQRPGAAEAKTIRLVGQPEHPSPQSTGGCLWCGNDGGSPGIGSLSITRRPTAVG